MSSYRQRVEEQRKLNWRNKKLHGQFLRQTECLTDGDESNQWFKDGHMKKETESLLMAAQEQSLRTRKIVHDIDHRTIDPKCRMCGEKYETVEHLVSACPKLAQTEYKARHDKVASIVHWHLCKKYGISVEKEWYKHQHHTACVRMTAQKSCGTSPYKSTKSSRHADQTWSLWTRPRRQSPSLTLLARRKKRS